MDTVGGCQCVGEVSENLQTLSFSAGGSKNSPLNDLVDVEISIQQSSCRYVTQLYLQTPSVRLWCRNQLSLNIKLTISFTETNKDIGTNVGKINRKVRAHKSCKNLKIN